MGGEDICVIHGYTSGPCPCDLREELEKQNRALESRQSSCVRCGGAPSAHPVQTPSGAICPEWVTRISYYEPPADAAREKVYVLMHENRFTRTSTPDAVYTDQKQAEQAARDANDKDADQLPDGGRKHFYYVVGCATVPKIPS